MKQELGETTDAMMTQDDQAVQDILNKRPSGHYYIVIHHKPIKTKMKTGEQVIMRHIKAYDKKPMAQVGMVILEVLDGDVIDYVISPHDMPTDWGKIEKHAGLIDHPTVFEKHPIAGNYIYN